VTDERAPGYRDIGRTGATSTADAGQAASGEAGGARVELVDISKRFEATQALDSVSLQLCPHSIHALVGENGAGKSTIVKILAGVHQPDSGSILLEGKPIEIHGPASARAMGIAVVHQEPRLFPDLTVAENVFLGHVPTGFLGTVDWRRMRQAADRIFDSLNVSVDADAIVRGLSMADQQLIEIAKALSIDAQVLILDEPTASLSAHEVERLFAILRQTAESGVAVLFVSHRLEEVFQLCDSATVLRDGVHVITAPTADLTSADLVRYMVGRDVPLRRSRSANQPLKPSSQISDTLLDVRGLTRYGSFKDITFSVHSGEIVALAGLVGAGRTEVARALFGLDHADAGQVFVAGEKVNFGSPSAALRGGLAYLPEDRHLDGLVPGFSVAENVTLPILPRLFPRLFLNRRRERDLAADYADRLRIRARGMDSFIESLSGGNQQKVVIAKWLATEPRILILDEPTRGIDVGAKAEVHRIVSDLAASGLAIVLISSELPEVLAMSDRIVVLHEGRISAQMNRVDATEEKIMFAATGQFEEGAQRGS
jgi:rhamnose transport system ATP-binding protein